MSKIFIIAYLIFFVSSLRGIILAMGKSKKLFKQENFLIWQKISLIPLLVLLWQAMGDRGELWLGSLCAIILAVFYLQPTPRISKYSLYMLLVSIVIFILILFL